VCEITAEATAKASIGPRMLGRIARRSLPGPTIHHEAGLDMTG